MKKLQTLLAIAVGGALLNIGLAASAQPAKPGYATVVRVKGTASYSLDNGAHKFPLVAGKFLEAGSTLYTGEDGMVDLVLGKSIDLPQAKWVPDRISMSADTPVTGLTTYRPSAQQNAVRMMADSTLVIDKLTTTSSYSDTVSDTELNLKQGGIYASVKKLNPGAQYLIKTPTGIAGVRGTEIEVRLNKDGTIKRLAVFKSHDKNEPLVLAITSPDGATQTYIIQEGEVYLQGQSTPAPITQDLRTALDAIFDAMPTLYYQLPSYDYKLLESLETTDFGF